MPKHEFTSKIQTPSRFRCASHKLNVELDRQNKIPCEQRVC